MKVFQSVVVRGIIYVFDLEDVFGNLGSEMNRDRSPWWRDVLDGRESPIQKLPVRRIWSLSLGSRKTVLFFSFLLC